MANDIQNILTISGNQKLIDEMLKAIQVDAFGRGSIDFKKVLPIPKDLDIPEGSDTREGIALVKDFLDKIPNEDLSTLPSTLIMARLTSLLLAMWRRKVIASMSRISIFSMACTYAPVWVE